MRGSKTTLLALALTAVVLTAWAANDAAANKPRSDKDNKTVVVPAQPTDEAGKSDHQAPQSRVREEQSPQSKPREDQAPRSGSRDVQAPQPKPDAIQAPASHETRESGVVSEKAPKGRSIEKGEFAPPPSPGGRGRPGGGGYSEPGGGRGNHGRDGGHFHGGPGWHGRHDEWRHRNFHGSWSFLFHFGPVIYFAPIHYPHIIRLPHDRVGVYVRYTGEDEVGSQFANSVRDHLREEGLRVVYSQDDARLELYIISMEQDQDEPGYGSSVSVSYIWYPGHKFITAQIVDAGIDEVDDLAQSVAGYADDLVDQYR